MEIKVLYHDEEMPKLEFIGGSKSDWIDVRASSVKVSGHLKDWKGSYGDLKKIHYYAGDTVTIDLGISMELPTGYEAHLLPRSSTFKNYGLILVNSMGVIDESYCGDGDHWIMQYYAINSGSIERYDRLGQFRVMPKMTGGDYTIEITEYETLGNSNREGIGSSGNR